jgi:lysosomal alpha-mannosidase
MAPSLGFNTYFVQQSSSENAAESWLSSPMSNGDDVVIKNEYLSITFDGTTGLLSRIDNLAKSLSLDVSQNLLYYTAYAGKAWPPSGAYIFRPNDSSTHPLAGSQPVQLTVIQGSQVQEVRQVFGSWGSQVVRLYAGTNHVEFEWTVGPIPIDDNVGKEVISRFSTPLKTNATFYTDANGREVLQRIRNYRATWPLNQTEPVAGNYYPVNSRIYVQDVKKNIQLTVLTDRSLGGSSINDGQIELMLHRRLLKDDSLGVGEPLNETGIDGKGLIVRGKHYVYLDDIASSVALHRTSAQRLYMSPSLALAKLDYSPSEYVQKYRPLWSGLKSRLPDNVHLLTLEQWVAGSILMRLEHFYEKNEDPVLSQPATVHLLDLFVPFSINTVVEMTLGANEPLADATRLQWTVEDYGQTRRDMKSFVEPLNPETLVVTLKPMQIRTFQIKLNN